MTHTQKANCFKATEDLRFTASSIFMNLGVSLKKRINQHRSFEKYPRTRERQCHSKSFDEKASFHVLLTIGTSRNV